jgi:transcriptional regulator with XRE-family HTH domain
METTVQRWTGRETRALRQALRMTVRDFGEHLGVSDRTVSKWEAGGDRVAPRPFNQACLDTALSRCTADQSSRFTALRRPEQAKEHDRPDQASGRTSRHPVWDGCYDADDPFWREERTAAVLRTRDVAGLYRLLQRRGVSQRQIAALTGQSQSEISEILAGRRVNSYDVLERIAAGIGVPRGLLGLAYEPHQLPEA